MQSLSAPRAELPTTSRLAAPLWASVLEVKVDSSPAARCQLQGTFPAQMASKPGLATTLPGGGVAMEADGKAATVRSPASAMARPALDNWRATISGSPHDSGLAPGAKCHRHSLRVRTVPLDATVEQLSSLPVCWRPMPPSLSRQLRRAPQPTRTS